MKKETKEKIRIAHIGKKQSLDTKLKISLKMKKISKENNFGKWMVGKKQTKETIEKRRLKMIGKKYPNRKGVPRTLETRKKISNSQKGEKSSNWKGGITKERFRIYNSIDYKLWRKSVFERDNYTCIFCDKYGGKLNADHIKPFALYPELRFVIDNGRTLCVECHRKTDTYGWRKIYKPNMQMNLES